jgi:crotonobetaine/carnitine-CoA ligase
VEYLQITDNDRLYTCLPLHHVNAIGAFLAALVAGASIVLGPRITISRFWEELAEARATVTYLLGPMVKMLWNRSAVKAETEHCARIALAPGTPAELFNSFEERFGLELMEAYGSTETNWVIGCVRGEQRPGYMGKVIEGFDARVIDERGHLVEDGSPGQLVLRPHRRFEFFTEYFRDPSYTNSRWIDGWFYTGDLVYREAADGYFRFIGRIGDTIRRLGENIVPTEVENALEAHPEVAEAAVFGVPSEFGEEEIMACVVPSHREKLDIQSLIVWCSGKLAPHSIPRYFEMLTELPRTSTGRIQKHLLRELGVTSQTYDRRTDT